MEIMTIRIDEPTNKFIHARANAYGLYVSDVIRTLIKIGLENTVATTEELKTLKEKVAAKQAYDDHSEEIKRVMREAYLYKNFKKLTSQLCADSDVNPIQRQRVIDSLLNRLKAVFGADSRELKEAKKWAQR
jgi:negative regulator of replication initiation